MVLSVVVYVYNFRWVIPATALAISAPLHLGVWTVVRVTTIALPRKYYVWLDDLLFEIYQRMALFFFFQVPNKKLIFHGDKSIIEGSLRKENAVVILNHQSLVDWLIPDVIGCFQNAIGRVRFVLKDSLRYIPWYGFYFEQHGCIYVKRGGKNDNQKTKQKISNIKKQNKPIWLVIFPEGTRYMPSNAVLLKKSQQFAKDKGHSCLNNVLTPRIGAFQTGIEELRSHLDAVYDITIVFGSTNVKGKRINAPSMTQFINGESSDIHLFLERIPIASVPAVPDKMQNWLHSQFEKKDRILNDFYSSDETKAKEFQKEGFVYRIKLKDTLPSVLFFSASMIFILSNPDLRILYGLWSVASGVIGCTWMSFVS